jgi:hypothetical protein
MFACAVPISCAQFIRTPEVSGDLGVTSGPGASGPQTSSSARSIFCLIAASAASLNVNMRLLPFVLLLRGAVECRWLRRNHAFGRFRCVPRDPDSAVRPSVDFHWPPLGCGFTNWSQPSLTPVVLWSRHHERRWLAGSARTTSCFLRDQSTMPRSVKSCRTAVTASCWEMRSVRTSRSGYSGGS